MEPEGNETKRKETRTWRKWEDMEGNQIKDKKKEIEGNARKWKTIKGNTDRKKLKAKEGNSIQWKEMVGKHMKPNKRLMNDISDILAKMMEVLWETYENRQKPEFYEKLCFVTSQMQNLWESQKKTSQKMRRKTYQFQVPLLMTKNDTYYRVAFFKPMRNRCEVMCASNACSRQ